MKACHERLLFIVLTSYYYIQSRIIISRFFEITISNTLKSLVSSYRLLDSVYKFSIILIEDERILQQLLNPLFANWLEVKLSTPTFEPLIIINQRRYEKRDELFRSPCGEFVYLNLGIQI